MARRTRRARERTLLVAGGAVVGGVLAASVTGVTAVDVVWSAAFAGLLGWLGARASPLALLPAAAGCALLADTGLALAFSAAAVAAAAVASVQAVPSSRLGALAGSLVALSLLRRGDTSALAGVGGGALISLLVIGSGWQATRRSRRRRAAYVLLPLGGILLFCAMAGVLAGLRARSHSEDGIDALRAARVAATGGDLEAAVDDFREAEQAFRRAEESLDTYGRFGRVVPGLSQQLGASTAAVRAAADVSSAMRQAGGTVELDELGLRDGTVDLAAVRATEAPLRVAGDALLTAVSRLEGVERRGLLPPIRDALDDAVDEARAASDTIERAHHAVREVPGLLGEAAPTRYLVLFTSPVEARNRFGFPGAYAILRFDQGRVTLERAGPIGEIDPPGSFDESAVAVPARAEPFRAYGAARNWRSVTLPSHGPAVADVAIQLAAQAGLGGVDGLVLADPHALAEVVDLVGGVAIPELDLELTRETTVPFLLRDQYFEFPELDQQGERKDALGIVAGIVGQRLGSLSTPRPADLTDRFGDLVAGGHLVVAVPAADRPGAASLFADLGLDGGFPRTERADVLYVGQRNNTGNKIDLFLERQLRYDVQVHEDGTLDATLQVQLTNTAPASGLPTYLIGSALADPPPRGTNRTTLLVYSRHELVELTIDGVAFAPPAVADGGLLVYQVPLDLAAGQTRQVDARFLGVMGPDPLRIEMHRGGLANPDVLQVSGRDEREGATLRFEGTVDSPRCVTDRGAAPCRVP